MINEEIIETGEGLKNGQQFCPNCGATQIYFEPKRGKLFCPYCESTFDGKKIKETETKKLHKTIIGSGAQTIKENFNNIITIKCNGCGAEVVIDTKETTQARCHWCRGILSINERIPNGAVPDLILPFKTTRNEAKEEIDKFVNKRKFYALPIFKKEYKVENVMGVYFPYMLIDANANCDFEGQGEQLIRKYTVNKKTRYDANLYDIKRTFNIAIEDLTIETSKDKLDKETKEKTNNIINSIMPFDTENCIRFQSNYLTGFTSEKRDTNIEDLKPKVKAQLNDIARHTLNKELKEYDRGIRWEKENVELIGTRWISAYLPVWIYSYYEKNKKQIHYIAVNARTKELMGSIPINKLKLFLISAIIEIIAMIISLFIITNSDGEDVPLLLVFLLLTTGIIYYKAIYRKYRNDNARHTYEKETKTTLTTLIKNDIFLKKEKGLTKSKIIGHNNTRIDGDNIKTKENFIEKAVNKLNE